MDLRLRVIAIFFSLFGGFVVPTSAQQSGGSRSSRKKSDVPSLSANINENPFLKDRISTTTVATIDYRRNPFLSVGNRHDDDDGGGNDRGNQQAAPVRTQSHEVQGSRDVNVSVFMHNPFLQPGCHGTTCSKPVSTASVSAGPASTGTVYESRVSTGPFNNAHSNVNNVGVIKLPPVSGDSSVLQHIEGASRTKSDLKCEEYARQISGSAQVLSLTGGNAEVIKVESPNCRSSNRLVIGGTEAKPGEFPHMVALGIRGNDGTFNFNCGGTLISPGWVLSAAHCTYGPNGSPNSARIGFHNLNDNQFGTTVNIKSLVRHPSYAPPAMYADIALVELETRVTFSPLIRPACLYQRYDTVPTQAWVSGWGVTEFGGETTDKLQKALLDVVDNIVCTIRHNRSTAVPHGITPSMICAGDPRGGWMKDTCQGDSGGPLQVIHPKNLCLFQVIGITSFGEGCANIDKPGVYTRVSHYLEWIEETVWPGS